MCSGNSPYDQASKSRIKRKQPVRHQSICFLVQVSLLQTSPRKTLNHWDIVWLLGHILVYKSWSKITSSTFDLFLIWTKIHLYKPPVQNLQKALFSEWWRQSNYQNPLETVDLDNLTSNPLNNAEKHAQSNNCQVTSHSECEVTKYDTLGFSNTGINIGQHASTCGREQSCH